MAKFLRVLLLIAVAFATPFAAWAESTRAIVTLENKRFQNAQLEFDPDFITADVKLVFNDFPGQIGQTITYAASSSKAQVQTAVRDLTNGLLDVIEPGNTLNNAQIILDGLSD